MAYAYVVETKSVNRGLQKAMSELRGYKVS